MTKDTRKFRLQQMASDRKANARQCDTIHEAVQSVGQ